MRIEYLICCLTSIVVLFPSSGESQSPNIKIGIATKVINPEVGGWVQGAGVARRAIEIRDDLEANGLYLTDGDSQILFVSCDLAGVEPGYAIELREAMGHAAGISPRDVLISCTHTHGGPSLVRTNYLMPLDSAYMDRLKGWLVELATEAVGSSQPGKIGWAKGAVQIGFNRRLTWADGTHTMHGDASRNDFAGLEGPDDPQHLALFAKNLKGELLSVLYHNTTHPTIFYGDGIYSADFPGEVRKTFRKKFKKKLPVLFLNGAQGDISMEDMLHPKGEDDEEKIRRVTKLVVDETMKLYKKAVFEENPVLKHEYEDLEVSVRLPAADKLLEARRILERIDSGENIRAMDMIMAFGTANLQERFGDHPFDILPVHALRIGELAIATQPCELYCQFGLDIKRRSPVSNTIVVSITDGYNGYCPTIYGLLGGGYSGAPISWTRLEPHAGYKVVETASRLLNKLWLEE